MKKKFNKGDRVTGIGYWSNKSIDGKAGTIIGFDGDIAAVQFDENICGHNCGGVVEGVEGRSGHCWWVGINSLKPIAPDKIIFEDKATILIKDGEKYVSKCADGDTYDKEKGLLLCLVKANGVSYADLQKMIDGAEDKNKEAAEKVIKNLAERMKVFCEAGFKALKGFDNANVKPEAENTVKEVKRPAKEGEYIKIVKAFCPIGGYKNGDILRVEKKYDGGARGINIKTGNKCLPIDNEYVVLENYKPYKITLSEFWKSEDKLAIHYENKEQGKQIFDLMIKNGFCSKGKNKCFWGTFIDGVLLNEKDCSAVAINESALKLANERGYKIYEADEVDLNN